MPVQDGLLIACKRGIVELTATVIEPHRDSKDEFLDAISAHLFDHQYQAMTDATILNPPGLALASCVVSRDPLPVPLKDGLLSLGFSPVETEAGGADERSLFARFQRARRSKLDKWRTMYLRAKDVSSRLGALEEILVEEAPRGPLPEVYEAGSAALIDAARTGMRLLLASSFEGVGQLERTILQERSGAKGRLVFHPALTRAIASFVSDAIIRAAPRSSFSNDPDDDAPLQVEAQRGGIVRSDPEFRVVSFVAKGGKELLTSYVESVLRQSLTQAHQP